MKQRENGVCGSGLTKESFLLYYNGGEIWFEHLDGMNEDEEGIIRKLRADIPRFSAPSSTSFLCFVFFDTAVTDGVFQAVQASILENGKQFRKVAFCGLSLKQKRRFRKAFVRHGFETGYFDGLEDAKRWLLP